MRRVILFSGMGGDKRMFGPLRVPGVELITPDHLEPEAGEDLPAFAERTADRHGIGADDVVGGVSFGGMLAAQISSRRALAGAILLASCHQPRRLPGRYRFVERFCRLVPDALLGLRSWPPFVRGRFAPIDAKNAQLMIEMARGYPPKMLRRFGRMIVEWSGVESIPCPLLSVHGAGDRILPLSCIDAQLVLPEAGHAFTLTHPEPIGAAIRDFLRKL
ncbi:MAG TPA: alpha/beta hydrolase [Elusimicrobiota bacterium]|nr:alpha/beta hydrolase [Elusimicrobiota bacterium]